MCYMFWLSIKPSSGTGIKIIKNKTEISLVQICMLSIFNF